MTDREEFEKWWKLFEDVPTSTWDNEHLHNLAILAWQARGELDAVKIKELEAKLDKAREVLELYSRKGWEAGWEHAVQVLEELDK